MNSARVTARIVRTEDGEIYGVALAYRRPGLLDAVLGAAILAGFSVYVFGVTVYFAGLEPNDFMFDTAVFAAFSVTVMLALLPVLVASFLVPIPPAIAVGLLGGTIVLAVVGIGACRAAPDRWEAEYR